MDLYQLRTFLEAAREQNFARAARALHVSPPAVSQSIALLERSIGRELFRRHGRRVTLTAEGSALKVRTERIFDEVAAARAELSGAATRLAELRLAVREMVTHYLLPPVLEAAARRHPQTRFALHELEPRAMVDALIKDQVDCGYYYSAIRDERLESLLIGRMSSHVYGSPRLIRRLGRPRSPRQTLRLPFVAPRPFREDPSAPSADGFPDHALRRDVRYRAEFLETHRRLAVQGLCVAVLPDGVAREDVHRGRLVRLPGPKLGRDLHFFQRKGRSLPELAREINAGIRLELTRWA